MLYCRVTMNTDVTVVCEFSCLGCIQNRRRGLTGECFCTGLLKNNYWMLFNDTDQLLFKYSNSRIFYIKCICILDFSLSEYRQQWRIFQQIGCTQNKCNHSKKKNLSSSARYLKKGTCNTKPFKLLSIWLDIA